MFATVAALSVCPSGCNECEDFDDSGDALRGVAL